MGSAFKLYCAVPDARGTVHSVFEHVVNLRVPGGLLSLAARDMGGSSRFLAADTRNFARFRLEQGQPCMFSPDRVEAGPLSVIIGGAPLWRGPLDKKARGSASPQTEARFKAILDRLRPAAGRHVGHEPALLEALGDESTVAEAVRGLIGLGPGLTPAGDDMLLGYLAVYNHLGRNRELLDALRAEVLLNLPRTTELSTQILCAAVRRDYHEYVQAVVEALRSDAAVSLDILLPRLLSVGASSGADMACGMAAALRSIREREESRPYIPLRNEVHAFAKNDYRQTEPVLRLCKPDAHVESGVVARRR